jgi:hypothetical protein
MSTAWLVFKTFFASLLPEGPPALANWWPLCSVAGGFDSSDWIVWLRLLFLPWRGLDRVIENPQDDMCFCAKQKHKLRHEAVVQTEQGPSCRYSEEL